MSIRSQKLYLIDLKNKIKNHISELNPTSIGLSRTFTKKARQLFLKCTNTLAQFTDDFFIHLDPLEMKMLTFTLEQYVIDLSNLRLLSTLKTDVCKNFYAYEMDVIQKIRESTFCNESVYCVLRKEDKCEIRSFERACVLLDCILLKEGVLIEVESEAELMQKIETIKKPIMVFIQLVMIRRRETLDPVMNLNLTTSLNKFTHLLPLLSCPKWLNV